MKDIHRRRLKLRAGIKPCQNVATAHNPGGESSAQLLTSRKNPQKRLSHVLFALPALSLPPSTLPLPHSSSFRLGKLCRLGSPGNSQKLCAIRRSQRCLHGKPLVLL